MHLCVLLGSLLVLDSYNCLEQSYNMYRLDMFDYPGSKTLGATCFFSFHDYVMKQELTNGHCMVYVQLEFFRTFKASHPKVPIMFTLFQIL